MALASGPRIPELKASTDTLLSTVELTLEAHEKKDSGLLAKANPKDLTYDKLYKQIEDVFKAWDAQFKQLTNDANTLKRAKLPEDVQALFDFVGREKFTEQNLAQIIMHFWKTPHPGDVAEEEKFSNEAREKARGLIAASTAYLDRIIILQNAAGGENGSPGYRFKDGLFSGKR